MEYFTNIYAPCNVTLVAAPKVCYMSITHWLSPFMIEVERSGSGHGVTSYLLYDIEHVT